MHETKDLWRANLHDSSSYVHVWRTSTSLMDAGANICLTGDLNLLVDVVEIPPLPISVAVQGDSPSPDECCTKRGYLPLQLSDGSTHCFYCKNAMETIISPQAILENSAVIYSWTQTGFKHGRPGQIRFDSHDGLLTMKLTLEFHDGLYYCPTDVFTVDIAPVRRPAINRTYSNPETVVHHPLVHFSIPAPKMAHISEAPTATHVSTPILHNTTRCPSRYSPTSKSKQDESEVWLLRLGSPGVTQLDILPPSVFEYHPFRFIDFKQQARIRKQAAQRSAVRTTDRRKQFYMDYGFMRASAANYSRPHKGTDWVVRSYDGYSSYLLIINEASCYVWVFLTASKDPPLDLITEFLQQHGHGNGGSI